MLPSTNKEGAHSATSRTHEVKNQAREVASLALAANRSKTDRVPGMSEGMMIPLGLRHFLPFEVIVTGAPRPRMFRPGDLARSGVGPVGQLVA
jgi:hypothetical protein